MDARFSAHRPALSSGWLTARESSAPASPVANNNCRPDGHLRQAVLRRSPLARINPNIVPDAVLHKDTYSKSSTRQATLLNYFACDSPVSSRDAYGGEGTEMLCNDSPSSPRNAGGATFGSKPKRKRADDSGTPVRQHRRPHVEREEDTNDDVVVSGLDTRHNLLANGLGFGLAISHNASDGHPPHSTTATAVNENATPTRRSWHHNGHYETPTHNFASMPHSHGLDSAGIHQHGTAHATYSPAKRIIDSISAPTPSPMKPHDCPDSHSQRSCPLARPYRHSMCSAIDSDSEYVTVDSDGRARAFSAGADLTELATRIERLHRQVGSEDVRVASSLRAHADVHAIDGMDPDHNNALDTALDMDSMSPLPSPPDVSNLSSSQLYALCSLGSFSEASQEYHASSLGHQQSAYIADVHAEEHYPSSQSQDHYQQTTHYNLQHQHMQQQQQQHQQHPHQQHQQLHMQAGWTSFGGESIASPPDCGAETGRLFAEQFGSSWDEDASQMEY